MYEILFQIEAATKETEESIQKEEDLISVLPQGPKQKTAPTSTVTAREAEAQEAVPSQQDAQPLTTDTCLCSQSHDATETHLSDLSIDNIETGGILPLLIDNKALNSENSSDYTDMDTVD